MGYLSPLPKLPVLNFSRETLKSGTSIWSSTCSTVRQALEQYGCFVAEYDKVSLPLHNSVFSAAEELFDLPKEIKSKNTNDKPYFGYVGNQPFVPPLYEGMGIDYANTMEGAQSFTNLMWPEGNDNFCETMLSYSKLISELEQIVKRMVFQSYGVEKYYESHNDATTYLLRLTRYRTPEMNETEVGCDSHTDKSFITILHQNEVTGLEIKTKQGDWIGFEPTPSSFIVLAGDACLAWSNGRIHSVEHRVVMTGDKPRYSVGIFSFNQGMIHIPEELADDEHPLQFKPFEHFGLLRYYFTDTDEGSRAESTARAYCGVEKAY